LSGLPTTRQLALISLVDDELGTSHFLEASVAVPLMAPKSLWSSSGLTLNHSQYAYEFDQPSYVVHHITVSNLSSSLGVVAHACAGTQGGDVKKTSVPKKATVGTKNEAIGNGGELHQLSGGTHPPLTTQQGHPISDDENSLNVSSTTRPGPALLEDFVLREKINHFDHERIPERIVHARGAAAHGFFELTNSLKSS
jgi:hypothetical protein